MKYSLIVRTARIWHCIIAPHISCKTELVWYNPGRRIVPLSAQTDDRFSRIFGIRAYSSFWKLRSCYPPPVHTGFRLLQCAVMYGIFEEWQPGKDHQLFWYNIFPLPAVLRPLFPRIHSRFPLLFLPSFLYRSATGYNIPPIIERTPIHQSFLLCSFLCWYTPFILLNELLKNVLLLKPGISGTLTIVFVGFALRCKFFKISPLSAPVSAFFGVRRFVSKPLSGKPDIPCHRLLTFLPAWAF